MDSFLFFVKQGFFHVFDWKAYDHILFLIVLTVIYTFNDWKKALWIITLFTIGHTTSLILSTYNVVHANARIVEFLIPITILITALVNIFIAGKGNKKSNSNINLIMALFFGMIHGLGFSSYFKMLVAKADSKFVGLLEFALGIEMAQLLIVFVILICAFIFQTIFRFSKKEWILIASSIVIGALIPFLIATKIW